MRLGIRDDDRTGRLWGWIRQRISRFRPADKEAKVFLVILIGWMVGIGALAILRYHTFRTNAFDMGIFNQAFSTALTGKLFYETPDLRVIPSGSFLGTHFNLLMFLLLPLYALLPRPETLLTVQTVFIGLGAVPVWLISLHVLRNRRLGLLLAAAFLFNPAILSLSLYDFHLEAFLPFFLGMVFYSFLTKWWRGYVLFLSLSFITFEFAPILVGAMSLAHVFRRMKIESRSEGRASWLPVSFDLERTELLGLLITICVSPVALFATLTASGYFSGTSASAVSITSGFLNLGGSSDSRIDLRAEFWLILFGVLLFLPLRAPRHLVMVLPWFSLTLLPAGPIPWYLIGYQYGGAFAAPFLIWSTVFALRRYRAPVAMKRLLPLVLVVSVFLSPLNPMMQGTLRGIAFEQGLPIPTQHDVIVQRAVELIPPQASVLAQNNLFTQVSGRSDAYVFLPTDQTEVEFVFADTSSRWYTAQIWNNQSMSFWLPHFLATGSYGVVADNDGVMLIQKGYTGPIVLYSQREYRFDYRDFILNSGGLVSDPSAQSGSVLEYNAPGSDGDTFWFGPYVRLPPGTYGATFWLKKGPAASGGLTLDVSFARNATTGFDLASLNVSAADFLSPDSWMSFTLLFHLFPADFFDANLEFRAVNVKGGPFYVDYISVAYLGAP